MRNTIKIATRKSPLALWQANYVKNLLLEKHPYLHIELIEFTTEGDKNLNDSLAKIGGKGLFVKELERSLLQEEADLAVHSMKDMTIELPEGLTLAAFCPRIEVRDAFVSKNFPTLNALPRGAVVGTSSLRRQAQLLALRPDLIVKPLRGNVNTRLSKLDADEFDAIILAAAGLIRLDLSARITSLMDIKTMLPAVGQAVVGVECRSNDDWLKNLLDTIDCKDARLCILTERAMNYHLGGGCLAPIAALATHTEGELHLQGRVIDTQGKYTLDVSLSGHVEHPELLGKRVAQALLEIGADVILKGLKQP